MIRTETYLNGRLVKEVEQIDVTSGQTLRTEYVDGRHRWLLDGTEVTEDEALDAMDGHG